MIHGWRPVPMSELEIESEKQKLQDEAYNLEYETKVWVLTISLFVALDTIFSPARVEG